MKIDLTTGTWQDNPGCPINITLVSTSDVGVAKFFERVAHGDGIFALMKRALSSASMADDMTAQII
jgi:hypothetical protein